VGDAPGQHRALAGDQDFQVRGVRGQLGVEVEHLQVGPLGGAIEGQEQAGNNSSHHEKLLVR